MSAAAGLLTLMLLVLVIAIVSAPLRSQLGARRRARVLRRRVRARTPAPGDAALAVAREVKYRELREAELDYRTGKLSLADYEAIRHSLRSEALQILNRLETAERGSDPQQNDRVDEQQNREDDRPAVEVTLHHRAAAEGAGATADAERTGEPGVLAGVHQHQQDQHDRDDDL
jgi:hypothetical protein